MPAQTNARAYVGHPEMTIDAGRKSAQAVAFFGSWSPDQRARFVRANGIDYVLAPDPAAVVRLAGDPELRRVDRQGPMALFKVMP